MEEQKPRHGLYGYQFHPDRRLKNNAADRRMYRRSGSGNPQRNVIFLGNIKDGILRAHPIREVKRQIGQVLEACVSMKLYFVQPFCGLMSYDTLFYWFSDIYLSQAFRRGDSLTAFEGEGLTSTL